MVRPAAAAAGDRRNLPRPSPEPISRPLPLLLAAALAGCIGEAPTTTAVPAAEAALAVLRRASPATADSAFQRLASVPHVAVVRVAQQGAPVRIYRVTSGDAAAGPVGPRVSDPLAGLTAGSPHLDPRTMDRYRTRVLPEVTHRGLRLAGAEAVLADSADGDVIRRVRSWIDASTGAPYAVEVWRTSSSAIFDEHSRAGVFFAPGPAGLPRAATSTSRIDVPFGPSRRVRMDTSIEVPAP